MLAIFADNLMMMKKLLCPSLLFAVLMICSCNDDAGSRQKGSPGNEPKTLVDSLDEAVDDDHIEGMSKMGRLTRAEQATRRMLDSIQKLPAKAREQAAPLKEKLEDLQRELSYAESAMNKWMNEFSMDSLVNDAEERINYLRSEKNKVGKVKEAILNGLEHADSLIRDKF